MGEGISPPESSRKDGKAVLPEIAGDNKGILPVEPASGGKNVIPTEPDGKTIIPEFVPTKAHSQAYHECYEKGYVFLGYSGADFGGPHILSNVAAGAGFERGCKWQEIDDKTGVSSIGSVSHIDEIGYVRDRGD